MIPTGGTILNAPVEEQQQPSLTWKLDLENKRITQMIDGLEAVKQSVFKILSTDRFKHLIYSFNYGAELDGLIGSSPLFVESEVKRRVTEALLQDDRINRVENFKFTFEGETVLVTFTVDSIFGSFEETREVKHRV
jgi:phage baseplate assembly protein W